MNRYFNPSRPLTTSLRTILKRLLLRVLPGLHPTVRLVRHKHFKRRLLRTRHAFVEHYGATILRGPFAGMKYVLSIPSGVPTPYLLGSYEAELHSALDQIIATDYAEIIDVGSGEGYYAIGLALKLPQARVHAFDISPQQQQLCCEMARLNGVAERVIVKGECNIEQLNQLPLERALIVSDCEGYELELLRPDLVPGLATADILVELHDAIDPSITPVIQARFAATHDVTLISSTGRDPAAYPELALYRSSDQAFALSEFRGGPMQWAVITANRSAK